MSGANQLPKYARVNREDQLSPLRAIGTEFEQRVTTIVNPTTAPAGVLSAALLASDLVFTAASVSPLAGPIGTDMCVYFQSQAVPTNAGVNPVALNSRFTMIYENQDVVAKTINFVSGFSPASVVIPASSIMEISWELTSLTPQTWTLFEQSSLITGVPPVVAGVTSYQQSAAAIAAGAPLTGLRTLAVQALPGDLAASDIMNVPALTIAAINVQAAIDELALEKVQEPPGPILAGDVIVRDPTNAFWDARPLAATEITNTPAGTIAAITVQAAITELDGDIQNKVTLRNNAGVIGTGADGAQDLLVAIAAGDQYVPSGAAMARVGRIGALNLGANPNVVATTNLFVEEVVIGGVAGAASGGAILVRAPAPVQSAGVWSAFVAALQLMDNFGSGAAVQSVFGAITSAIGVVDGLGGNGAYYIHCAVNGVGVPRFWVSTSGITKIVPAVGVTVNTLGVDAGDVITIVPSKREYKKNIEDLPTANFIQKLRPVRFEFKEGPEDFPRYGLIIEEMQEAGAGRECFGYRGEEGKIDQTKPISIDWNAITAALIAEVQSLRSDVEQLKARLSSSKKH